MISEYFLENGFLSNVPDAGNNGNALWKKKMKEKASGKKY